MLGEWTSSVMDVTGKELVILGVGGKEVHAFKIAHCQKRHDT